MANTKSAKKRARISESRRVRNVSRRSDIKTACKKVLLAIETGDVALARSLVVAAESKIARGQGKGIFKKNAARRKISRLSSRVAKATRESHAA